VLSVWSIIEHNRLSFINSIKYGKKEAMINSIALQIPKTAQLTDEQFLAIYRANPDLK